jgi:hypothetical protein
MWAIGSILMIRNPRRYPGDNYTGLVIVTRAGWKPIPFESTLEMHWLVQTDAFRFDLRSIEAQPFRLQYWFDGRYRTWTPDFLMQTSASVRPCVVEIKTIKSLYPSDPSKRYWVEARFKTIEQATAAAGYNFMLATEREIRIQPRQYNADMMTGAIDRHYPIERYRAGLTGLLSLPQRSRIPDLQRALGSRYDALDVALHHAWRGELILDPSVRWSRHTTFVRSSRQLL